MPSRRNLLQLADTLGLFRNYTDAAGRRHTTGNDTRERILSAWGFDVSTESAAGASLRKLERNPKREVIEPVRVLRPHDSSPTTVSCQVPFDGTNGWDWCLELSTDTNTNPLDRGAPPQAPGAEDHAKSATLLKLEGHCTANPRSRFVRIPFPGRLAPGYYNANLALRSSRRTVEAKQLLVVSPGICHTIRDAVGSRRLSGLWMNLYTLRSERNWGLGDLGDLCGLIPWAAHNGLAFLGLNPLHALRNCDEHISPYSPLSRLFRNFVYLEIEAVPEYRTCARARSLVQSTEFETRLRGLQSSASIDYSEVSVAKLEILRLLFVEFRERHLHRRSDRGRSFQRYVDAAGSALVDFATFLALDEHAGRSRGSLVRWRQWPKEFRKPMSTAVGDFRKKPTHQVQFWMYVQFELDRQLAVAAERAESCGLPLGLYHDLALGSANDGFDPWAFPALFLDKIHVGCPPDAHSATGQDWSFSPIDPMALRRDRYRYWRLLLRNIFSHARMVRIDHVMGLFRQFWIPQGLSPRHGTYVAYPAKELLAILALESRKHKVVVVGEDLGTVPRGFQAQLARRGILSSRVQMFEHDRAGRYKPASSYSRRALVTANTHDLPPLASWMKKADLMLRARIDGTLSSTGHEERLRLREKEIAALLRRLRRDGFLLSTSPTALESLGAAYQFLLATPAALVGISLDDLAGETEPVNLPGIGPRVHQSWSRKMTQTIEELTTDSNILRILRGLRLKNRHRLTTRDSAITRVSRGRTRGSSRRGVRARPVANR